MRIATRVAVGTGMILVLVAGASTLQTLAVVRLAAAQRDLAEVRLPATALALDLADERDRLEEYLRKHAVTGDAAYGSAVDRSIRSFGVTLDRLLALQPEGGGTPAVEALRRHWRRLPLARAEAEVDTMLRRMGRAEQLALADGPLRDLERQITDVVEEVRADADRHVLAAGEASARARRVSLAVLVAAVVVGVGVSVVTVRSINRPLGRLVEATRRISAGAFDHRVRTAPGTELAVLADHFNQMTERLAELDRLKRDFLSHVSHEIKTPLVAMEETTHLLLEEVPGSLTERQRRLLELHLDSHRRLRRMISDLLDLSRMEAGVLDYSIAPGDLATAVREAVAEFEQVARARGVRLAVDAEGGLPPVAFDRDRIVQVVQNLLSNALRFSPPDEQVEVRVGDDGRGTARIEVADRGPGVPESERERIFDRFHQVPGSGGGSGASVGLGLAICRQIVAAHDGDIRVEDAAGGGARFVVELPGSPGRSVRAPHGAEGSGTA